MSENPLILKLQWGYPLDDRDRNRLEQLCDNTITVEAQQDLISEGERPEDVHLVLEGMALRYKILPNGRRSIMALLIPGDFCDLHVAILGEMDHTIATLDRSQIVKIPRRTIGDLIEHHPGIARALWWATLVDEGVLREWLANMGRRPSDKQMAHLFCEMFTRMAAVNKVTDGRFRLPLTQEDLGDVLGMSTVQVNRTLRRLREQDFLEFINREVEMRNIGGLRRFADFDPNYLHLGNRRSAK